MSRAIRNFVVLGVCLFIASLFAQSQTTYHLHKEASSTSGLFQLTTAGPDGSSIAVESANLQNQPTGEYLVKAFDTPVGVPNASGAILADSTVTFTLWMKKTANVGTMFPRAKLRLNNASGALLCTATGSTALTTTLSSHTISCTTQSNISINTSTRFYVWVGVNLTATSSSTFRGELDVEGTLNGSYDSRIVIPAITPPPAIASVSPSSGRPGSSVTITGTNFRPTQGFVHFPAFDAGMPPWEVTSWSDTTVVATVGTTSGGGLITVTTAAGVSNGVAFTVDTSPYIDSLLPTSGQVGTEVTINGSYFAVCTGVCGPEDPPAQPSVTFNGVAAQVNDFSDTSVIAVVPSGATTGNVVVTNQYSLQSSNGVLFTVGAPPAITSLNPTNGQVGTSVTISGSNFGATQGSSTVSFNGTAGSPTSWSATSIVVPVPSGATTGNVTVTTANGTSNGVNFTVVGHAISTLSPPHGAWGGIVKISGTGFGATQGASTVFFNGEETLATNWSDSEITAMVPAEATTGPVTVVRNGAASNTVNFTVLSAPAISNLSPNQGPEGQTVTISGQGFGATQSTSTVSFGMLEASATTWSDTSVVVAVPTNASSGSITVTVASVASNGVGFTVSPKISNVLPASGGIGASVNIVGRNFGTTQGTVTFNGTSATVTSWSDRAIAVTVPSTFTGNVVVNTGTLTSNAVPFTVVASPVISDITPSTGTAGTEVTINGSGFGATQSNAHVVIGDGYGVIASWSDNQIQANVPLGAQSGVVQVSRGGVLSNSVTFTVSTPQITTVTPSTAARGESVTVTGSGFGSSQASGNLWLGTTYGIVTTWSDTEIVAKVASTSKTGTAKVFQGGVWSDPVGFTVTGLPTEPAVVTLSPSVVNLVVGQTFSLQALDSTGAEVQGLTWNSSEDTIVSLSTDDPPVLTALTVGHTTITASDGSADVFVHPGPFLPDGTIKWSTPGDGSGVFGILPAVPSSQGVADVFAVQQSGKVLAVTPDGRVAWTATVGLSNTLIPDFQGGLIVAEQETLRALDGLTGQPKPAYNSPPDTSLSSVLVHTDGTVFAAENGSIVAIDPITGGLKFRIQLEESVGSSHGNCGEFPASQTTSPAGIGQGIIAGDGFAYFPYAYILSPLAGNMKKCDGPVVVTTYTELNLRLLRVGTDGSNQKISLGNWVENGTLQCVEGEPHTGGAECPNGHMVETHSGAIPDVNLLFNGGTLITNADQGALYTWQVAFSGFSPEYKLTSIPSSGSASTLTITVGMFPVLQREDGDFFGSILIGESGAMAAFDGSGDIKWSGPDLQPLFATSGGGLIARSVASNGLALVNFNNLGQPVAQSVDFGANYSWGGRWYSTSEIASIDLPLVDIASASFWPQIAGNQSVNRTAIVQCPCLLQAANPGGTLPSSATSPDPIKHLLLVGDPGLANHNVGRLFELAAETKSIALTSSGSNEVIISRISTVQDFNTELTTNGTVTGEVQYFGHGGQDGRGDSALFVGEDAGANTNVTVRNVSTLSNSALGTNVQITLLACHAGLGGRRSIAQQVANQLRRTVWAYPVGVFFSANPTPRRWSKSEVAPSGVPTYMVPDGDGIQLIPFPPEANVP